MRITVHYFALLRESVGKSRETRDLPDGSQVLDLLQALSADYPIVGEMRASSMLMLNQEYVEEDAEIRDGDDFALIPPVAGGDGTERFKIVDHPLDPGEISRLVEDPSAGAVVLFLGNVRDNARGRKVVSLEYEAYAPAAEKMLARIGDELRQRWGIERVAIHHRVGHLKIGETSVVIAVASPHRAEAFEGCRHAIERIKQIVPIWKKEHYRDGDSWIGSEAAYQSLYGVSSAHKNVSE
ncbi:MAG TPA: MoaD family protein [Thermomicrobiaceae bacterium]|nr:MoaD family protein [Thermomicrobiaceae bacterium]